MFDPQVNFWGSFDLPDPTVPVPLLKIPAVSPLLSLSTCLYFVMLLWADKIDDDDDDDNGND